ncbi:hypothetical protein HD554DRAFT_2264671 [Boletus coccyginus]|nr:hypothetical protein HD554DRAFT_2264671 [Boletus coccyginus]
MALVQSLPTWDETIVPALRKRLESESRILAKRMSIASVSSVDDSQRSPAPRSTPDAPQTPRHLPEPRKSSAIPRPSLQYSRTTADPPSDASSYTRVNGASSPPKRARTYSQPPNPLPTPDSSRPTSPRTSDVKPTRIPIAARTRTASTTSHAHSIAQRADSRNGSNQRPHLPPTPDTSQDLWVVRPSEPPQPSTPPIASIRHKASNIITNPLPSRQPERPFEHWYRGDVHRNGGVGELRVARRVEMLQIANYGHNLRKAIRAQTRDSSGQMDSVRGRKRADSVGTGTHDSLYLDDDPTKDSQLTDIDPDTDPETFYDAYINDTIHSAVPGHPLSSSRILDDNNTPKDPLRTSAESTVPTPPASRQRAQTGPRTTSPTSLSSDQSHTKRRAKSPVASSPASTPKKARIKAKTAPPAPGRDDPRNSVATYPTPEGDMVDAIPTWTQPVQKSGNWDEVVLPVVARKKGLDGQYEHAVGSPKPKSRAAPVEPAPGTFGYDYTKYRPPRRDEEIQMREFGSLPEHEHVPLPEGDILPPHTEPSPQPILLPLPPTQPEEPIRPDPRQTVSRPPESPAPFAHYRIDHRVPTINITRPSLDTVEQRQGQEDDHTGGGCCKCVIM